MKIIYSQTPEELGYKAARHAADLLRGAIAKAGSARLLMSTGTSQFTTIEALVHEQIDWRKVEMFHLDEYIGISPTHPASFIRYLKERFVDKVDLGSVNFIETTGDISTMIEALTNTINKSPIDVGLVGIGENAHIAFNDPPAVFNDSCSFKIVSLTDSCRQQQLGEKWFNTIGEVPERAVTMTTTQIMKCRHIICAVPFKVKAQAIHDTLTAPGITPMVPSTLLREHGDTTLYLDRDSASMIDISEYCNNF